jgi:Domain of unknown function (DUF5916)/Carbohydrate family 9 binding domain-like
MNWNLKMLFIMTVCLVSFCEKGLSQSQDEVSIFPPVQPPKQIKALRTQDRILIDGKLIESPWKQADSASRFFQVQPLQGERANPDTQIKILYDDRNLYIAAFNYDSLGKKGIRVPDLSRDFQFGTNDIFGVSLDPFLDKRNAIVFQTNPYAAQRDLLAFDDQLFDRDWDALWRVRTQRTAIGWSTEMAIPWKTLRYPKDSITWGINFLRIARRLNQSSSWNPYPRATNNYRMAYAGQVTSLQPPPPSANIRVNPFFLYDIGQQQFNGTEVNSRQEPKLGGEIKWAVNPNSVLDITVNTDFAQADVDRQVNNLTRFSVFFPERRQFFLENASLFSVSQTEGITQVIQPFFSRSVGLDASGNPIPIDAGARFVSRTQNRNYGGMVVRQRQNELTPAATFAIGRYSKNFGKENHFGGMVTSKINDATATTAASRNFTYTTDIYFRLSDALTWNVMSSLSTTTQKNNGFSAVSQVIYRSNKFYGYYYQSIVNKDYDPQVGFLYSRDIINTDFGGYRIIRKNWVPKKLRQIDPGFYTHIYHRASDGKFLQAELELFPFYTVFQDGGVAYAYIVPTWQTIESPLKILNIPVALGDYYYTRYRFYYGNDQSKKFSYGLLYETGNYYNGQLDSWILNARYSPVPHVALSLNYQHNSIRNFGENSTNRETDLITPQIRLALNPRLQWISFYQYNTAVNRGILNTRLSWEYAPLSFVYFVYNNAEEDTFNSTTLTNDRLRTQAGIFKITFMKQF